MLLTVWDLKRCINMALGRKEYHIAVSVIEEDRIITEYFSRGITPQEFVEIVNKANNNKLK